MLSIRSKILIPLVLIGVLVFMVLESILSQQIGDRFNLMEEQQLMESGLRVERTFQDEVSKLQDKLVEWAQWDAAYEFGKTHDLGPIGNDLDPVVLTTSDFDFMLFLDTQQQPFYTLMRGLSPNQTPSAYLQLINQLRPQLAGLAETESLNGYMMINQQPFIIAAGGLRKSNNQGTHSGYLILGRAFGPQKQMSLALRTHLKVWFESSKGSALRTGILQSPQNTLILRRAVQDLLGQSSLQLVIEQEHTLLPEATGLKSYLRMMLGLSLGVTIVALLALLEITVVQRLIRLRGETRLALIDLQKRPKVRGNDEIATLARKIGQLLDKLQETDSQVREQDIELKDCLQVISSKQYREIAERRMSDAASRDRQLFWIRHLQQLRNLLHSPSDKAHARRAGEVLLQRLSLLLQLESHTDHGNPQLFDLRALCLTLRHEFEPLAQSRGLSLHWSPPAEHLVLLGDEQRLHELLAILLENAINLTHSGSVTLHSEVSRQAQNWQVRLRIQDTGPGMPNEQLLRVQAMLAAPHGHPARMSSTGLGLQLATHLCESLQGTLTVESQAGIGCTFDLLLTLPDASQPEKTEMDTAGNPA